VIAIMLAVALLFGGFGVWDTWNIYHNAGVSSDLLKFKPNSSGYDTPNPSLEDLQKINPDVCAWLTVDETHIDYPVVQGENNWEYLNWGVDGEFSLRAAFSLITETQRILATRCPLSMVTIWRETKCSVRYQTSLRRIISILTPQVRCTQLNTPSL
jgi:hypothetical protein